MTHANWGSDGPALRLGFRQLRGLRQPDAERIVAARKQAGRFTSIPEFHRRTGLSVATMRLLAEADAFASLGLSRRQALWEVLRLKDEENPLFDREEPEEKARRHEGTEARREGGKIGTGAIFSPLEETEERPRGEEIADGSSPSSPSPPCLRASVPSCLPPASLSPEPPVTLPTMPLGQEVMIDYHTTGLSLKQHPVALVREELRKRKIISSKQLAQAPHARWVKVAGLVLIRQRPGTASGIVFETLEDETGIVNLIIKPDIYDRYRPAARHAGLLQADGYVQRSGQVIHVMAKRLFDLSDLLAGYELKSRDFH
jgi:DNA polymerase III alpha subunit